MSHSSFLFVGGFGSQRAGGIGGGSGRRGGGGPGARGEHLREHQAIHRSVLRFCARAAAWIPRTWGTHTHTVSSLWEPSFKILIRIAYWCCTSTPVMKRELLGSFTFSYFWLQNPETTVNATQNCPYKDGDGVQKPVYTHSSMAESLKICWLCLRLHGCVHHFVFNFRWWLKMLLMFTSSTVWWWREEVVTLPTLVTPGTSTLLSLWEDCECLKEWAKLTPLWGFLNLTMACLCLCIRISYEDFMCLVVLGFPLQMQ